MKRIIPILFPALFFLAGCNTPGNKDLIAWWSFDKESNGLFVDQSGHQIMALNRGAVRCQGKIGQGLHFDGKSVLQINHLPLLDSFTKGITIAAWIKKDTSSRWNTIVSREIGNSWSEYFGLAIYQDKALFSIDADGKNYRNILADSLIEPGRWYHLAGTFDNARYCLFINGKLVQTGTYPSLFAFSDQNPIFIGGNSNDQNLSLVDCFTGTIDELRIYNRALSEKEIEYWSKN